MMSTIEVPKRSILKASGAISSNPNYESLVNYFRGEANAPSVSNAVDGLMQLASDVHISNNTFQKDVVDAMIRQPNSNETIPFNDGSDKNEIQPEGKAWARLGLNDPFEILSSASEALGVREKKIDKRLPASERKALEILGAADNMSKSEMRKIYKELVKDLHPDRNSGSRDDEERLTEVVWAWDQLKASRSFKEK